jgi:hypothetical protein
MKTPTINEKCYKILAIGLNESAPDGEWQSAAIRFFFMLRKNKAEPEHFINLTFQPKECSNQFFYAMPFGKHKGTNIIDVPDGYIIWIWENMQLREPLKTAVEKELERRGI